MAASRLTLADFTFRRARPDDYEGVMRISDGIYGGRDILPSVYHDYIQDPNRLFYVAVNKRNGQIVSTMNSVEILQAFAFKFTPVLMWRRVRKAVFATTCARILF